METIPTLALKNTSQEESIAAENKVEDTGVRKVLEECRAAGRTFIFKEIYNTYHITSDTSDTPDTRKNWVHITKVTGAPTPQDPKPDLARMVREAIVKRPAI